MDQIDVVIPCHEKDVPVLDLAIEKLHEFASPSIGSIYVVSDKCYTQQRGALWIPENSLPCKRETTEKHIDKKHQVGWYWQQVMQFYLPISIQQLSDRFLLMDADVVFLKPVEFIVSDKVAMNYMDKPHEPYRGHIMRLIGDYRLHPLSGVCHWMVYDKAILNDIRTYVEDKHGCHFDTAYYKAVDQAEENGAAEFELYYQWMNLFNPGKIILRKLAYEDKGDYWNWYKYQLQGIDYVAFHAYMRK